MKTASFIRPDVWALLLLLLIAIGCQKGQVPDPVDDVSAESPEQPFVLSEDLQARMENLLEYGIDPAAFPRSMENGELRGVTSSDWTSGFLPGSLWYAYRITEEQAYSERAKAWTVLLEQEQWNDRTHDMGFKVYSSFGNGYEITKDPFYKEVILQSAATLSTRYNSRVGCLKSWDFGKDRWLFPVIIDNMMNLELLFEATRLSGDSTYYEIAYSHALRTLNHHFREDNSSYHVVDFNPVTGAVIKKLTHQGYADESAWARGQAWGLYGFTMLYRYTRDPQFMEQASKIHEFLFQHPNTPPDRIFYWDLDDPAIPDAPRDASASAIVASALLELYAYDPQEDYLQEAEIILSSLASPEYLLASSVTEPFILDHSTGNKPQQDEIDVPIAYADYYFLEAVWRRQQLEKE